ncbi:MAG: SGNH/GDSL hydrolase family protein, partial [Candidatus Zapsychrus exili]|nr:SGNH/GDSL hydrolase family protein [Candidatus Zapsychrus exili]
LALFNYRVDPNYRYSIHTIRPKLKKLAESNDLALCTPTNYNDRVLIENYMEYVSKPRICVLGGSYVLNFQPEMLAFIDRSEFLNLGVTAGNINDYIAIWQLIKDYKKIPDIVIVCVEFQSLCSSQSKSWISLQKYYSRFFNMQGSILPCILKIQLNLKDLLSLETTIESFRVMIFQEKTKGFEVVKECDIYSALENTGGKTRSFSKVYPKRIDEIDENALESKALYISIGATNAWRHWAPANNTEFQKLEKLLRDIKEVGSAPVLVLMPYHPTVFQAISRDNGSYEKMTVFRNKLLQIARREDACFYDAMLKYRDKYPRKLFRDGVHLSLEGSKIFMRDVLNKSKIQQILLDSNRNHNKKYVK